MAVQAVKSGAMNSYQAARHFHVPRGTVAEESIFFPFLLKSKIIQI
jgi:hypothetical protein